jgi:putative glutamine transport system substrate-binding protein
MKKICLIFLFVFSMFLTGCVEKKEQVDTLATIKSRGELVVGVKYDSKPFGFVENGKLQGYDIDIAHLMAKRILGNERLVRFVEVNASNRISLLNSGEVDMVIATMTITPQRKEVVDFSLPYFYAGQAIMIRKGSYIKKVTDLNGRRVIVVLGSTGEKNLRYFAPESMLQGYKTYEDAFNAMLNRKAEALTTDDAIIAGFLMSHPEFKMLPQRYSQDGYGIALRKGEENASLKREVDMAIAELGQKGYLTQLKTRWLPASSLNFK